MPAKTPLLATESSSSRLLGIPRTQIFSPSPALICLRDYEVSFLRLLEKITQGSKVEINYTGTAIYFYPGFPSGGSHTHVCPLSRGMGWFLEPILALAPFGKRDLVILFKGVTSNERDASVDMIRISGLPHLARFLEKEGLELRILKRGYPPSGGGEAELLCPSVAIIKGGVDFRDPGRISKIRGIAHCVRVSPQEANRCVVAARSVLNRYIPDIHIYTDVYRGEESGKSPGYALTLVSTSTTGTIASSECSSCESAKDLLEEKGSREPWSHATPDIVGSEAALRLLSALARGGCVDSGWDWLVLLLLTLGSQDVGRTLLGGPLDPFLVQFLRDLRTFFGTSFKFKPNRNSDSMACHMKQYTASCVGVGFRGFKAAA